MSAPIVYGLQHARGTVSLSLDGDRFIVQTQGIGLADRLRTIDLRLGDLEAFAIVPTLAVQGAIGRGMPIDTSFDAELMFAYREAGARKTKRCFVKQTDPALRAVVDTLARARPDASLLALDAATAQKRIGVMPATTALRLIVAVAVLLPLVVIAIALLAGK